MAFSHSSLGIEDREIRKFGLSLIEELYNERFEQLHETESDITEKTLMDIFLNNFEKFSKTEILENLATLLIAGYDTTTTTVSNVILMLAIHPEIQEKLYSHIEENFKDFTEENLNKLDYLNQVMNETMRLFPAAPVIFRSTTDYLELDGQILPKNTNFILNFFALHRNKAVWGEDAEKFDPNRFSRAAVERRHPFAFLPFSGGKRNCVGKYELALEFLNIFMDFFRISLWLPVNENYFGKVFEEIQSNHKFGTRRSRSWMRYSTKYVARKFD